MYADGVCMSVVGPVDVFGNFIVAPDTVAVDSIECCEDFGTILIEENPQACIPAPNQNGYSWYDGVCYFEYENDETFGPFASECCAQFVEGLGNTMMGACEESTDYAFTDETCSITTGIKHPITNMFVEGAMTVEDPTGEACCEEGRITTNFVLLRACREREDFEVNQEGVCMTSSIRLSNTG